MKLSTLFSINAVVAILFGLAFVLAPGLTLSIYGIPANPALNFRGQLFGAALVGFAVISWSARNDPEGLIGLIMSTHPDLALLDWDLPGRPVKEMIDEIKQYESQIRLIVLGKHPGQKNDVLQVGADAYVEKSEAPEKLLLTLQAMTTQ